MGQWLRASTIMAKGLMGEETPHANVEWFHTKKQQPCWQDDQRTLMVWRPTSLEVWRENGKEKEEEVMRKKRKKVKKK